MNIDGNRIAKNIIRTCKETLTGLGTSAVLSVFVVGDEYATEKFVTIKKKMAEEAGIQVKLHRYSPEVTTAELVEGIKKSASQGAVHGIIVQLPLPQSIDVSEVLGSIPVEKDVDVLSPESIDKFRSGALDILPPVAGAISEILEIEGIDVEEKRVVVVGKGALVGIPASVWFERQGAHVVVADRKTRNFKEVLQRADIIVSGAGVPGLITPDMIKKGVILFDAGTSEASGKLRGDADPRCAEKCSIFTPVPGGLGPVTIAVLLRNITARIHRS